MTSDTDPTLQAFLTNLDQASGPTEKPLTEVEAHDDFRHYVARPGVKTQAQRRRGGFPFLRAFCTTCLLLGTIVHVWNLSQGGTVEVPHETLWQLLGIVSLIELGMMFVIGNR